MIFLPSRWALHHLTPIGLAASCGVGTHPSPTTFSPCGFNARHPMLSASGDASRKACGRRPHLSDGCFAQPGSATGRLHQHHSAGGTPHRNTAQASWRCAPAGMPPLSKRHRAMSHCRATATIPIRLTRVPPPPKRSRTQPRSALSGWSRPPRHANAVVLPRTGRFPALGRPCSRARAPRWSGGGVQPAQPPTSRRFCNVRQAKHARTTTPAPWIPMPLSCLH
jgi:hypothetical protein